MRIYTFLNSIFSRLYKLEAIEEKRWKKNGQIYKQLEGI